MLAVVAEGPPRVAAELARQAGVSASVVRSMADAGLLKPVTLEQQIDLDKPDWDHPRPVLSPSQAEAAAALVNAVERSVDTKEDDGFLSSCWMGSQALAKRRFILKRLPQRLRLAARFWLCCRRLP